MLTDQEKRFWEYILEIAKKELSKSVFEAIISQGKLLRVTDKEAVIAILEEIHEEFWNKHVSSIVYLAGWEFFDRPIQAKYTTEHQYTENKTEIILVEPSPRFPNQNISVQSNLDSHYSFNNFVQGEGNRWALSAAITVAETPGAAYNPLFIWGGPGLGKTHLLNAIGNQVLAENPYARVKYIPTESFVNDFLTHLRLETMNEFKEKLRYLDVLLIDDIQSLPKKAITQEEFFNTFDALYRANKQIVLTSDRPPNQLNGVEQRLVTRFSWGLTHNITPPDYETRIAIIQEKIRSYNYTFPMETIEYLAGQFESNVRELEGALKNISLMAKGKKMDTITVDLVNEAIQSIKQTQATISVISIDSIQEAVAKFYGVTVKEIKAAKRTQNIVLARQVAMFLTREMTDYSLPKIGKEFGGRDHSTVLHAYNKIRRMIAEDDGLKNEVNTLKKKLR